jgi:hypothetical protein
MAFVGTGQKLIGDDGAVYDVVAGTEASGDGATPLTEGHYLVTAVADAASGWPGTSGASGASTITAGRIIEVRDTDTAITPAATDKYVPLTLTELCDMSSWSVQFSSDEVEITSFCNDFKTYRAGKDDAQGTVNGIFTIGITDKLTGFSLARNFIDIMRQDGGDTIDVYQKTKGAKLARLVLNDKFDLGDYLEMFVPIEFFGFNLGAEQGANAQTFDSGFRFSELQLGAASVDVLPTLYRRARSEENT